MRPLMVAVIVAALLAGCGHADAPIERTGDCSVAGRYEAHICIDESRCGGELRCHDFRTTLQDDNLQSDCATISREDDPTVCSWEVALECAGYKAILTVNLLNGRRVRGYGVLIQGGCESPATYEWEPVY